MDTIPKVGMREFRANLPQYLMTASPVAITRHGETIGFYIPARNHPDKTELEVLKQAALKLDELLLSGGVTEDELFQDFHALRKEELNKK